MKVGDKVSYYGEFYEIVFIYENGNLELRNKNNTYNVRLITAMDFDMFGEIKTEDGDVH